MSTWDGEPPVRDLRRLQPDEPRPGRVGRRRTQRRRWCRGRVGIPHDPLVVRLAPWTRGHTSCHWLRRVRPTVSWWWLCVHERVCTTCGKVLERGFGAACPARVAEPTARESRDR